jgi:hypothetical protein
MAQEPAPEIDVSQLAEELKARADRERAAGGYADDLSGFTLEKPQETPPYSITEGFDLRAGEPRVRFRPELGFSTKPVIGPVLTFVKRSILRLLRYVFDDLARQTDAAIGRVEAALAVEIATRERLERELERKTRELEREIQLLREKGSDSLQ